MCMCVCVCVSECVFQRRGWERGRREREREREGERERERERERGVVAINYIIFKITISLFEWTACESFPLSVLSFLQQDRQV